LIRSNSDDEFVNLMIVFYSGMPSETATAVMSLLMGGILERFPRLKICFAHGGGSFPYTIGRMQHGFLVRPDLCAQVDV
jgi:aminocarboxymuconate-semialdehyde decarboxylase